MGLAYAAPDAEIHVDDRVTEIDLFSFYNELFLHKHNRLFRNRAKLLAYEAVSVFCIYDTGVLIYRCKTDLGLLFQGEWLQGNRKVGADNLADLAVIIAAIFMELQVRCKKAIKTSLNS